MQFDWLVGGIKSAAKLAGLSDFPDQFYVIDFNLLTIELSDWQVESDFFKANPKLGQFYHYPILGALLNPLWFGESERKVKNMSFL